MESCRYYQERLDRLNAEITTIQVAIRKAADDYNRQAEEKEESKRRLKSSCLGGPGITVAPFLLGDARSRANLLDTQVPLKTQHLDSQDGGMVDAEAGDDGVIGHVTDPAHTHSPTAGRPRTASAAEAGVTNGGGSDKIITVGGAEPTISLSSSIGISSRGGGGGGGEAGREEATPTPPPSAGSTNLVVKILRSMTIDVLRVWFRTVMVAFYATQEVSHQRAMVLFLQDAKAGWFLLCLIHTGHQGSGIVDNWQYHELNWVRDIQIHDISNNCFSVTLDHGTFYV